MPFTIYSSLRFNRFVLLNTNAGYAFFWANHPIYGSRFLDAAEMGDTYQKLIPPELRRFGLDEAELDQELLKRGIAFVVSDPLRYIRLSLSRFPVYFKFWPDADSGLLSNIARTASFAIFLPFMLYGLLLPLIHARRPRLTTLLSQPVGLLYLFIFVYTAIHLLSWALIRYRLPVDAVLIIFAALALAELSVLAARRTRPATGIHRPATAD